MKLLIDSVDAESMRDICPFCGNMRFKVFQRGDGFSASCPKCKGMWSVKNKEARFSLPETKRHFKAHLVDLDGASNDNSEEKMPLLPEPGN